MRTRLRRFALVLGVGIFLSALVAIEVLVGPAGEEAPVR